MTIYIIESYVWAEEPRFETAHHEEDWVSNKALELSNGNDRSYRITPLFDGERQLGMRFFSHGKEFTHQIIQCLYRRSMENGE